MIWTKHKKAVKGFAFFLLFMGICYLVAKGIYTSSLPRVSGKKTNQGTIAHQLEAYGSVRQGQEFGIYVPQGLRVATIYAREGQEIAEGTPLFAVDTEDLKDIIAGREIEIAGLRARQDAGSPAQASDPEVTLARAREDYELVVKSADLELAKLNNALAEAKKTLEDYQKRKAALTATVSGGDVGGQQDVYDSTLQSLRQAVQNAQWGLETAVLAKESQLLESNRKLEDAESALEESKTKFSDMDVTQMTIRYQQAQLDGLKKLLEEDGVVTAAEPGILITAELTVGSRTPDGACLVYAREEDMKVLEIVLTGGEEKYVQTGDVAELSFSDSAGEHIVTEAVDYMKVGEGSGTIYFYLEDTGLTVGQTVKFSFTKKSKQFPSCISADAVSMEDQDYGHVFVIEESEGFFGKEYVVCEKEVRVLDANDRMVAVEEGYLMPEDLVVVRTSKELKDGDVVRVD